MRQPVSCSQKAMDLLSRRSHFRRELENKLQRRGYAAEVIEETLGRLTEKGFLDDRRTAEEFIRGRLARAPVGRLRLLADLGRRGVESHIAEAALDSALPEDEVELTRAAAARWLRSRTGARANRDALARHLASRGFPGHVIFSILQSLVEDGSLSSPSRSKDEAAADF